MRFVSRFRNETAIFIDDRRAPDVRFGRMFRHRNASAIKQSRGWQGLVVGSVDGMRFQTRWRGRRGRANSFHHFNYFLDA